MVEEVVAFLGRIGSWIGDDGSRWNKMFSDQVVDMIGGDIGDMVRVFQYLTVSKTIEFVEGE